MTKTDVKKLTTYWLTTSEYDFKTVKSLLNSKKYPYALFFLHLSIEKLIKAVIVSQTKQQAPFNHNLLYLLGKTTLEPNEKILMTLEQLSTFNLESRYPDEQLTFYKIATKKFTETWYAEASKVIKWLKKESKIK